jgi:glutamate/tyrosine decarboxylase-like PLP-dependent enzyme
MNLKNLKVFLSRGFATMAFESDRSPYSAPSVGRAGAFQFSAWDTSRLSIRRRGEGAVEAWFLGPKAENAEILHELIGAAIDRHIRFRRECYPEDPEHVTPEIKAEQGYLMAREELRQAASELFEALAQSVPFASLRYQGHMLWDQALPAIVGYFGAMLYNQNNVAAEASPITTQLEISVGNDLCRMLGLTPPPASDPDPKATYAWGHITADGSIANIEGLWAARNARYLAVSVAEALRVEPALAPARPIQVTLPDGRRVPLLDLDPWTLLNLPRDTSLTLAGRIGRACKLLPPEGLASILQGYSIQHMGLLEFHQRFLPGIAAPVILVPATAHYSWAKAATLLGLGQAALHAIPVDNDGRMDVGTLEQATDQLCKRKIPVIAVVAVIGSTEESAVDPLDAIIRLRDSRRIDGLDFAIHADAAWGGYFASLLRDADDEDEVTSRDIPIASLSSYAEKQYRALPLADSITVDPHKAGYIPYPAGALCYRNSASRDLISLRAPVIFHGQSEPTVGIYGVEGSKPGAAAAAVWLAHRVIGADRRGYGRILGECLWTSKRLYARLASLKNPHFRLVPLAMLPAERAGKPPEAVQREREWLRRTIVETSNAALQSKLKEDELLADLFRELGSDQVIIAFALNPLDQDGTPNTSMARTNALNDAIFRRCSLTKPGDPSGIRLFLTSSSFDPAIYGQDFVDSFCRRLGVTPEKGQPLSFLINTTMDPWTTEVARRLPDGTEHQIDFLAEIEAALVAAAEEALKELANA